MYFWCLVSWLTVIFVWEPWGIFFTFVFGRICCKRYIRRVVYMLFEGTEILFWIVDHPSLCQESIIVELVILFIRFRIKVFSSLTVPPLSDIYWCFWDLRFKEVLSCESLNSICVLCVFSEDSVARSLSLFCQEFRHKLSVLSLVFRSYLFEGIFSILHSWIFSFAV